MNNLWLERKRLKISNNFIIMPTSFTNPTPYSKRDFTISVIPWLDLISDAGIWATCLDMSPDQSTSIGFSSSLLWDFIQSNLYCVWCPSFPENYWDSYKELVIFLMLTLVFILNSFSKLAQCILSDGWLL